MFLNSKPVWVFSSGFHLQLKADGFGSRLSGSIRVREFGFRLLGSGERVSEYCRYVVFCSLLLRKAAEQGGGLGHRGGSMRTWSRGWGFEV